MQNLFDYSKPNMTIVILILLMGLNVSLCLNSRYFLNMLNHFTNGTLTPLFYYLILASGFITGIFLSAIIPPSKNKISEFSGIPNKLFNYIDYLISFFAGYFICFSLFIIIGIMRHIAFDYFWFYNYDVLTYKTFIFIFGCLNGFYCKLLIDNKIIEINTKFTIKEKTIIFIIFVIIPVQNRI